MQRTTGSHAGERLLQNNAEEHNAVTTSTATPHIGHNFTQIPVSLPNGSAMQTKLAINKPGDEYEQEADSIAEQVMRMPEGKLQRTCACSGVCSKCKADQLSEEHRRLQTKRLRASNTEQIVAPPIIHEALQSPGQALDSPTRAFMEPRFGHDLSRVRVHTGGAAARAASSVNAHAFTVGRNIAFANGQYAPDTMAGRRILAHELTHVLQQSSANSDIIQRDPTFPDSSCSEVDENIEAAWPVARDWAAQANRRLADPSSVAGALMQHFKIDPDDPTHAADLATVRQVFRDTEALFDQAIDNTCTPPTRDERCFLPDGRRYAAWVHPGQPGDGITHCLTSADAGALSRQSLIHTLLHEMAHLADPQSTDHAYSDQSAYESLSREQAIRNADSYSEFAREQFTSLGREPVFLGFGTGLHLSGSGAAWAVTTSESFRSRTGLEVIDLVGGVHLFIAIDPNTDTDVPVEVVDLGAAADIGFQSRSPHTRFLADFRVGAFISGRDLTSRESSLATGVTTSLLLGWANSDFRAGINLRAFYDVLHNNHAVIIGGQFDFGL
jgi:hypothetical protein